MQVAFLSFPPKVHQIYKIQLRAITSQGQIISHDIPQQMNHAKMFKHVNSFGHRQEAREASDKLKKNKKHFIQHVQLHDSWAASIY